MTAQRLFIILIIAAMPFGAIAGSWSLFHVFYGFAYWWSEGNEGFAILSAVYVSGACVLGLIFLWAHNALSLGRSIRKIWG